MVCQDCRDVAVSMPNVLEMVVGMPTLPICTPIAFICMLAHSAVQTFKCPHIRLDAAKTLPVLQASRAWHASINQGHQLACQKNNLPPNTCQPTPNTLPMAAVMHEYDVTAVGGQSTAQNVQLRQRADSAKAQARHQQQRVATVQKP